MSVRLSLALASLLLTSPAGAEEETKALLKELRSLGAQGAGSTTARAAWEKLVARGPTTLVPILQAMDSSDTVTANWLRTAFDRIAEPEITNGGKQIDRAGLLAFIKEPQRQGRARRLALEMMERLQPGTQAALLPGWLNDPEFRYEAVENKVQEADQLAKAGDKAKATAALQGAFTAARDADQCRSVAARLKDLGVAVSVADHLGFLRDWFVIGPLDAKGMKGFKTVYPPEKVVDLKAELDGKEGKVHWKHYAVREAATGLPARLALVNLPEALGHAEDAVAFAYTQFAVPEAREVEFRGAADDNFAIWVNGQRVYGFEEYRNGVRLDRHRFRVKLQPGVNRVLVKVCQAPSDPTNKEPNWEFLLRVVDLDGRGLAIKSALPPEK